LIDLANNMHINYCAHNKPGSRLVRNIFYLIVN